MQYLICRKFQVITTDLTPERITPDYSICVNIDCVPQCQVDRRTMPLLARMPCTPGRTSWHASPPYYVRLSSHHLEHLRLWFTTESGKKMAETVGDQVVICVLHFRRRHY